MEIRDLHRPCGYWGFAANSLKSMIYFHLSMGRIRCLGRGLCWDKTTGYRFYPSLPRIGPRPSHAFPHLAYRLVCSGFRLFGLVALRSVRPGGATPTTSPVGTTPERCRPYALKASIRANASSRLRLVCS